MTSHATQQKSGKSLHIPSELAHYRNPYSLIDFAADVIETTWEARALARAPQEERHRRRTQLRRFITCIVKRASVTSVSILAGIMWIERLKTRYPRAEGGEKCGHRLFLVALIVASKMFADGPKTSRDWSTVSGVFDSAELDRMEDEFLTFLQDDIRISPSAFDEFVSKRLGTDQVVPMEKPVAENKNVSDEQDMRAPSLASSASAPALRTALQRRDGVPVASGTASRVVAPQVMRVKVARKLEELDDVGVVPECKRQCAA
eukprot:Opistho-2@30062